MSDQLLLQLHIIAENCAAISNAASHIRWLEEENADLKISVIAFLAPWAVQWAKTCGRPEGELHPTHYDMLFRCGGRMDDFTRGEG